VPVISKGSAFEEVDKENQQADRGLFVK